MRSDIERIAVGHDESRILSEFDRPDSVINAEDFGWIERDHFDGLDRFVGAHCEQVADREHGHIDPIHANQFHFKKQSRIAREIDSTPRTEPD